MKKAVRARLLYVFLIALAMSSCVIKQPASDSQATPQTTAPQTLARIEEDKFLNEAPSCTSAEDFQKIYEFLNAEKDLELTNVRSIKISFEVLNGCTGSADRFIKVYSLLKKSGVSLRESFKAGLDFSKLSDERTDNFIVIFKDSFLNEFLDFSFDLSYRLAFQLSKELPTGVKRVREDFHKFVSFCTDSKKMGYSLPVCAKYTLQLVDLTQKYQHELFTDFERLYQFFTDGKGLKLTISEAIPFCFSVLNNGPHAADNFFKTLKYSQKMNLSLRQSLELSLIVSQKTHPENKTEKNESKLR